MRVLVVYYGGKSTFIQRDIDILSKHFDVDEISIRKIKDILSLIKKIRKSDIVFVWFAGKHAGISVLLAKLFHTKSVVVVGGYDAANVPEINYGLWAVGSFLDKTLAKIALKMANKVIAVSKTLVGNLRKYANINREILVIPTGYDPKFWRRDDVRKGSMVLTVAYADRFERVKIKGIDIFLKIAQRFPDVKFRVIGIEKNVQKKLKDFIKSENVEILPPLSQKDLIKHYQQAKVFCLLSWSEGLPNTLCEAMLCECIPVVTNVGGMPEAVDNCGFVVNQDENNIYNAIKKALDAPPELGRRARERIIKLFPSGKREKMMLSIINELVGGKKDD